MMRMFILAFIGFHYATHILLYIIYTRREIQQKVKHIVGIGTFYHEILKEILESFYKK